MSLEESSPGNHGRRWRKYLELTVLLATSVGYFALLEPASAQVQENDSTARLVKDVTEAFFDLLPQDSFATERAFMTDDFATQTPLNEWKTIREKLIVELGATPRLSAHRLTFYEQDQLLAAVDFSGRGIKPDTHVCGFILWEIPEPNKIGFLRIELNTVPVDVFKSLPLQQAAQLMADWHCPMALIEDGLGIAVQ